MLSFAPRTHLDKTWNPMTSKSPKTASIRDSTRNAKAEDAEPSQPGVGEESQLADASPTDEKQPRISIRIRLAEEDDAFGILSLNRNGGDLTTEMSHQQLSEYLESAEFVRVAEKGSSIVGFVAAARTSDSIGSDTLDWFRDRETSGEMLCIERLVICDSVRGIGLGSALYEDLVEYAQRIGVSIIGGHLTVRKQKNWEALDFAKRHGFKSIQEIPCDDGISIMFAKKIPLDLDKLNQTEEPADAESSSVGIG